MQFFFTQKIGKNYYCYIHLLLSLIGKARKRHTVLDTVYERNVSRILVSRPGVQYVKDRKIRVAGLM